MGYDSVNTARGALPSLGIVIDGCRAENHPLICRFMKGVFHLRPPTPRYTTTWDVLPVLQQLRSMHPLRDLSLKDLTLKLVMLMSLTQAARVQTLIFPGRHFRLILRMIGCVFVKLCWNTWPGPRVLGVVPSSTIPNCLLAFINRTLL